MARTAIGAVTFQAVADPDLTQAKFDNGGASGDTTAVAAAAGKATRLYRLLLVVSGATNITIKDGSTALTGAMPIAANGSITLDFSGEPWFVGSNNTNFIVNSSNAVNVEGSVWYTQG